ncbi:hypothetical protein NPIL_333091 [Nephila pilipes]|uniref:Uncharacterized protein n=1 Tax=Nephila pilipes TaxID=299642 RepID=A0A8X6NIL9_NEPPI|nr:hypothetical protein NPIL_333091 [Nephila pilipes]
MGSLSRSNYGEKKQQLIVTLSSFIDNFRLLHKIVDAYKYVINESLPRIVLAMKRNRIDRKPLQVNLFCDISESPLQMATGDSYLSRVAFPDVTLSS